VRRGPVQHHNTDIIYGNVSISQSIFDETCDNMIAENLYTLEKFQKTKNTLQNILSGQW